MKRLGLLLILLSLVSLHSRPGRAQNPTAELAYIKNNVVTLADGAGQALSTPGPELGQWQSANLFWSPDGESLYIATRQGLYVTGGEGGAAVRLPGDFGLTVVMARHGEALYNLDVDSPQDFGDGLISFPLRETALANMQGGRGRLVATIGEYQAGTANASLNLAAAVYARDNGLLEGGRPQLFPTYGGAIFFTCCFPREGLGVVTGDGAVLGYDSTLIPAAAALNATLSRLAGPTTEGTMRIYDLISEGSRDYALESSGPIEATAWAIDETALYYISREAPPLPLELRSEVPYQIDTRSANLLLWELNLVTGGVSLLADLGEAFGASSMAVTDDYIFVVLVESNARLIEDLNRGALAYNLAPEDPLWNTYIPRSLLWRVERAGGGAGVIDEGVWSVVARPR